MTNNDMDQKDKDAVKQALSNQVPDLKQAFERLKNLKVTLSGEKEVVIDLSCPFDYVVGFALGVVMEEVNRCQNQPELENVGQKSCLVIDAFMQNAVMMLNRSPARVTAKEAPKGYA